MLTSVPSIAGSAETLPALLGDPASSGQRLSVMKQITEGHPMTGSKGVRVRTKISEIGTLSIDGFCRFLRAAFPRSTALHLAHLTGISASTVTKWLIGENKPSGEHLAILTSVLGPAFLRACLTRSPDWLERSCETERLAQISAEMERLARERAMLERNVA